MEEQKNELFGLLGFALEIVIFYLPCMLGSVTGFLVRRELFQKDKRLHKQLKTLKLHTAFITSITPAVIMALLRYTPMLADANPIMLYGIAFFLGVVGEDISGLLLSLRNIVLVLKACTNGADGIKTLAETIVDSEKTGQDNESNDSNLTWHK